MSNYKANPTECMACPHCGAELEGVIADYIVPGKIEELATALGTCDYCNEEYTLSVELDGRVKVSV